jgi:hypothetical protein
MRSATSTILRGEGGGLNCAKLDLKEARPLGAFMPLMITLDVDSSILARTLPLDVVAQVRRILQKWSWRIS